MFAALILLLCAVPLSTQAAAESQDQSSAAQIEVIYARVKALAVDHAFDVQIAREGSEQRDAHLWTAWSRWIPRLDLQLSQSRGKDYSILTSGALGSFGDAFALQPQTISLSRWALNLSFPLYDRNVHTGVMQSIADRELGESLRVRELTQLDWRLRQLFGACLLEAYRDAALKGAIDLSDQSLREAQLRFELGQKTRVDVLRAKAQRTELESRRLALARSGFRARSALLEYAGISSQQWLASGAPSLLGNEQALTTAIDAFTREGESASRLEPYLRDGSRAEIEQRVASFGPEFRRLKAEEALAEKQSLSLSAGEWPSLRLQATWNKQAPDWSQAFEGRLISYSTAVVLNIPIFTGGALFSSPAEGRHARAVAQLRVDRGVLELRDEIEGAVLNVHSLRKSLESLRLSLEQNEEIVRLSMKSYALGKATIVELLGAQNDLIQSKVELARAKIDLSVQLRQLAWNLGLEDSHE